MVTIFLDLDFFFFFFFYLGAVFCDALFWRTFRATLSVSTLIIGDIRLWALGLLCLCRENSQFKLSRDWSRRFDWLRCKTSAIFLWYEQSFAHSQNDSQKWFKTFERKNVWIHDNLTRFWLIFYGTKKRIISSTLVDSDDWVNKRNQNKTQKRWKVRKLKIQKNFG